MVNLIHLLRKKSLLIVFAYLPTGLGHLRVTDALYHGLPPNVSSVLLGSQDDSISAQYSFISIHPFFRALLVQTQVGFLQEIITPLFRWYLHNHTHLLSQQLETILDEQIDIPQTLLLVSTHFGLAHQLAALKKDLFAKRKIRIILAVQVTDDTPQEIWYVPGADIIFTPSEHVKDSLVAYGKKHNLPPVLFEVNPYPLLPSFAHHTSEHHFSERAQQLKATETTRINMSIPVSGAAIGMQFFRELFDLLHSYSVRYMFHVVVKQTLYTQRFITDMLDNASYVQTYASSSDRETVSSYERLYQTHNISLEITKPSEQSFKALFRPYQVGGSILLLADPVGQQEMDNLAFMHRHGIIPSLVTHTKLWNWSARNKQMSSEEKEELLGAAKHWRGLRLPEHAKASAMFIHWCLEQGVFSSMLTYQVNQQDTHMDELGSDGTTRFWERVAEMVK